MIRPLRFSALLVPAALLLLGAAGSGCSSARSELPRKPQERHAMRLKGTELVGQMVEAHGGRMWASANEPRGAVFQFTLPLEQDESIPAQHVRSNPAA